MRTPKARKLPSGSWFIQLRINGQSISITDESEKKCVARAMAVKSGLVEAKSPNKITVTQAIDDYIASREPVASPATIRGYKTIQRNYLQDLMPRPASSLTLSMVQAAINKDAARVGNKTLKNVIGLLSPSIRDYCDVNFDKLALPQPIPYEPTILTYEEAQKLLTQCKGTYMEFPILMAMCLALRRSEIIALQKSDFDFEKKTVRIEKALVPQHGKGYATKGSKTLKSYRTLSCPDFILDVVQATAPDEGTIFRHSPNSTSKTITRLCRQAGIPEAGLHDLRHLNASVMLNLNVPDLYAMERGGWSSNYTMKRIYQHTMTAERDKISVDVNTFFTNLQAQSTTGVPEENGTPASSPPQIANANANEEEKTQ